MPGKGNQTVETWEMLRRFQQRQSNRHIARDLGVKSIPTHTGVNRLAGLRFHSDTSHSHPTPGTPPRPVSLPTPPREGQC